jgi:hypothetical protein
VRSAPVFSACLGESTKLREVFTMPPTKDQALQPVWLGYRRSRRPVIGQPFTLQENKLDHLYLPTSARTSIANWRPRPELYAAACKASRQASTLAIDRMCGVAPPPPPPHMRGRGGTPWGLSASQPPVEFRPCRPPWVVGAGSGRVPGPKFAAGTAAGAAWRMSGSLGGPATR